MNISPPILELLAVVAPPPIEGEGQGQGQDFGGLFEEAEEALPEEALPEELEPALIVEAGLAFIADLSPLKQMAEHARLRPGGEALPFRPLQARPTLEPLHAVDGDVAQAGQAQAGQAQAGQAQAGQAQPPPPPLPSPTPPHSHTHTLPFPLGSTTSSSSRLSSEMRSDSSRRKRIDSLSILPILRSASRGRTSEPIFRSTRSRASSIRVSMSGITTLDIPSSAPCRTVRTTTPATRQAARTVAYTHRRGA